MPEKVQKFFLFIDESGDHGLINLDTDFPVFLLCGLLVSEENYHEIHKNCNEIKRKFWGEKEVIFHSRDIRKHNKEFQILFNDAVKKQFYQDINELIVENKYRIIASAIDKEKYIKRYGKLSNDVYELALSFIIERSVFSLDEIAGVKKQLHIIIEKRGKKEEKKLEEHFQRLLSRGTGFVDAERLRSLETKIIFKDKKDNDNGLQLADLIAYPIARYIINPARANPSFDVLSDKIYTKNGKRYGLKKFP